MESVLQCKGEAVPKLIVAEIPVNSAIVFGVTVGEPKEEVAEIPVNGTPIPITTDPTEEVAETPVG